MCVLHLELNFSAVIVLKEVVKEGKRVQCGERIRERISAGKGRREGGREDTLGE